MSEAEATFITTAGLLVAQRTGALARARGYECPTAAQARRMNRLHLEALTDVAHGMKHCAPPTEGDIEELIEFLSRVVLEEVMGAPPVGEN